MNDVDVGRKKDSGASYKCFESNVFSVCEPVQFEWQVCAVQAGRRTGNVFKKITQINKKSKGAQHATNKSEYATGYVVRAWKKK